jgi:asparagine synthase (glutamine-hydrolysing)
MSAIFGACRWGGEITAEELEPVASAMRGWAGSDPTLSLDGRVAFGHGAPRTSNGAVQPLRLAGAEQVTICADARLTEREALAGALGIAGQPASDAELILRAYLRWGERCVERLFGAFAFAIWDERRGRMLLGRDHLGLRPLYFWRSADTVVFATGVEGVLAFPEVPRRPDLEALWAMLIHHFAPLLERSLFTGVYKVAPGQLAIFDGGSVRRHVHWRPRARPALRLGSPQEYGEALREVIERAVADAVAGEQCVGAHVSGGLDSSAVAVIANRALRNAGGRLIAGYSWSPPRDQTVPDDERDRVDEVLNGLGVPVRFTPVDREMWSASQHRLALLQPQITLMRESAVLRVAAADGVEVMLSGWGGDELSSFNGRGHLASLLLRGRWRQLRREAELIAVRMRAEDGRLPAWAGNVRTRAINPLVPEWAWRLIGKGGAEEERALQRAGVDWAAIHPRALELWRQSSLPIRQSSARRVQLELLGRGHLTARVEAWAAAAAEHGIEHRYPLLDRRVIELCLSFPETLWLRDGWKRWVFRAAVQDLLPESIVWADSKDEPAFAQATTDLGSRNGEIDSPWPEVRAMIGASNRIHAVLAELRRSSP